MVLINSDVFDNDNNKYTVKSILGEGGFGQVFKVINQKTKEPFALKVTKSNGMRKNEFDTLINEGMLSTSIDSNNVIKVKYFHDGKTHNDLPAYILMEYANEGNLEDFLYSHNTTLLENSEILELSKQIIIGMKAINEKILHRDVHPQNILIKDKVLKITDFGLSKVVDHVTRTNTFKGTQHIKYKAPESWQGETNNIQLDMYSVGLVLYEIATLEYMYKITKDNSSVLNYQNTHLFTIPSPPSKINRDIPEFYDEIIAKLVKKKPSDRFKNWDECLGLFLNQRKTSSSIDLSNLVAKARATSTKIENQKIKDQEQKSKTDREDRFLTYASKSLMEETQKVIEEFNSQTSTSQLSIYENTTKQRSIKGFTIRDRQTSNFVEYYIGKASSVITYHQDMFGEKYTDQYDPTLKDKKIILWGYVKNSNDNIINIILTRENDHDYHGSWYSLKHELEPFFSHQSTVNSFTDWNSLVDQISRINVMSKINTCISTYQQKDLIELLEDIM